MLVQNSSSKDTYLTEYFFGSNHLTYSDLRAAQMKNVFENFSIKYVYKGVEYYKIGAGEYKLSDDEVLYAISQPGEVYFDNSSHNRTIGLCLGMDENLFLDALRIQQKGCFNADPEKALTDFRDFCQFLEGKYQKKMRSTLLLRNVASAIEKGSAINEVIDHEWFFTLASEIVSEELPRYDSFHSIKASKLATRKELLNRLSKGKEFMDDEYLRNPSIPEIARVALLSEFHFFRTFKTAYGISPYQYMLSKRLNHAKVLLQHTGMPINQIASIVNFPHQFAFAKAFKQKFKVTPKEFKYIIA